MASLRRLSNSPYWIACFSLPDGRRTNRSTGSTDRKEAQRIANKFEDATNEAKQGRFVEARARQTIADIFAIANNDTLASSTIKAFFEKWLERKAIEAGDKTHLRYKGVVEQLLEFMGAKAAKDISHLNHREIAAFRDSLSGRLSAGTVNVSLKTIRAALSQAQRDGLVDQNEAKKVTFLKRSESLKRRPFSIPEIRTILGVANTEWHGMIMFGFYTGFRLGDIARLTWENLDMSDAALTLVTKKTNKIQNQPIAKPLYDYLMSLPSSDNPQAPIFPKAFACYGKKNYNGALSKQFYEILASVGLVKTRLSTVTGKGKSVRHSQNELSFHCFRHTATTLLKIGGVSDAVARDIIGHESVAVSRNYTHIDMAAKRKALETLPDILKS